MLFSLRAVRRSNEAIAQRLHAITDVAAVVEALLGPRQEMSG